MEKVMKNRLRRKPMEPETTRHINLTLKPIIQFLKVVVLVCLSFSTSVQALELIEGKYEVIDTGVSYSEFIANLTWLNNHLLLINYYTDGRSGYGTKDTKTIIFDTKTKKKSILTNNLAYMCTNKKTNISVFKNMTNNEVKFFNLSEDGKLTDVSQSIDAEQFKCSNITLNRERLQAFLLDEESYIDSGKSGNGGKEQAILYLKNKAPIELPFRGHVVDHCRYIPFKNKYLLNSSDINAKNVNNPYFPDEPFFYFMSPEGEIEKVPQPIAFYEQFNRFSGAYPMRDGMVLDVTGLRNKKGGLFYLKGDKVIRIYGKSPPFIIQGVIDAPFTAGHTVSADGCSIAFASILKINFDAHKPVKIINVCEEK